MYICMWLWTTCLFYCKDLGGKSSNTSPPWFKLIHHWPDTQPGYRPLSDHPSIFWCIHSSISSFESNLSCDLLLISVDLRHQGAKKPPKTLHFLTALFPKHGIWGQAVPVIPTTRKQIRSIQWILFEISRWIQSCVLLTTLFRSF